MDKINIVNTFTNYVDQLRSTECSQKEKISCFQHIAECILSPALVSNINYATHCSTATNVLLMFCEDLDSTVRMSAEENLNRIFRALERTRVSRILFDLYGEIKRNGNQRSLRICLNLFAYYAPQVKEKHVKWYALRLSQCLQTIALRKETLLCESLCEFVKSFGKYLQIRLPDSETCKLFEVFIANIGSDCAVKRRCSSQNCISLIENSHHKSVMASHGLNKVIEMLLKDQQTHSILGALGFLRILLPLIIRGFVNDCKDDSDNPTHGSSKKTYNRSASVNSTCTGMTATTMTIMTMMTNESKQIIEIFDYCLHLLSISHTSNHSIINASLEVINAILQAIDGSSIDDNSPSTTTAQCLQKLLSNQQLQHNEYLRRRKSLKNQIFQLKNYEMTSTVAAAAAEDVAGCTMIPAVTNPLRLVSTPTRKMQQRHPTPTQDGDGENVDDNNELNKHKTSARTANSGVVHESLQLADMEQQHHQQRSSAFKLGMQKIANAKKASTTSSMLGIHAQDDNSDSNKKNIITDDVDEANADVDDNDDEANKNSLAYLANVDKQQIENRQNISSQIKNQNKDNDSNDDYDRMHLISMESPGVHDDYDDAGTDGDDEDDDDFTTLSEINEPQKAFALTTSTVSASYATSNEPSLTTTIDVDNLIDAIDATAKTTAAAATPQEQSEIKQQQKQQLQLLTVDAVAATTSNPSSPGEDKSQNLSDIDNESFNSIDFEAEITIGGYATKAEGTSITRMVEEGNVGTAKSNNTNNSNTNENTTIGSFFNNLLTHPSTETMTKLFRPSSLTGGKSTPTNVSIAKSGNTDATITALTSPTTTTTTTKTPTAMTGDKSEQDGISINSGAAVSMSAADTLSLESITSGSQRHDAEELPLSTTRKHSYSSNSCGFNDETLSTTASVTASTAILMDSNTRISSDEDDEAIVQRRHSISRRTPNINPFLKDSPLKQTLIGLPQLNVSVGSIFEQSIIFYTARLTAARFLLTGQPHELQTDQMTRVSIKNLSLCVVAQCVRLAPQILTLTLEISPTELENLKRCLELAEVTAEKRDAAAVPSSSSQSSSTSGSPTQQHSDSSSNLGKDYEHLNAGGDVVDFVRGAKKLVPPRKNLDFAYAGDGDGALLLEMKDDHFGVSTTDYFLNQPLSRSVDPVLLTPHVSPPPPSSVLSKTKQQHGLSKSEIIESTRKKIYQYKEDVVPSSPPPRPPKRIKSLRKKMEKVQVCKDVADAMLPLVAMSDVKASVTKDAKPHQQIADVLLFFAHVDPILRGGVQQIIGNYMQSSNAGLRMHRGLRLNYLLAILMKGLQDEIHTVVIHALNAFDKAFPLVLAKYLTETRCHFCHCCCHQQQQQQHEKRKQTVTRAFEDNSSYKTTTTSSNIRIEKNPNDAATNKLCCRTCSADPCNAFTSSFSSSSSAKKKQQQQQQQLFIDNDELIATLLNSFQLKSKNILIDDNGDMEEKLDNDNEGNLVDDYNDNNDPHVDDGLYNKLHHIDNDKAKKPIAAGQDAEQRRKGQLHRLLFISPKLLLNKLRLCYHNKYWLVQSKYAEVISNLNYAALQAYYLDNNNNNNNNVGDSSDVVLTYEQIFLDEILQLIADDDVRVREHAAECLCHFIIQNAKHRHQQLQQNVTVDLNAAATSKISSTSLSTSSCSAQTFATNFNLLWDFFDYRIFSGMSPALRNLFSVQSTIAPPLTAPGPAAAYVDCNNFVAFAIQRQAAQEEKLLAKVLYRLSNKLMEINDKNTQFGIIYALKLLLKHFNFVDYQRAWTEFNLMEICMKLSYYNYATAVDLNCQNDLIDVTGKLMAGTIISLNLQQQQFTDNLLRHILKIINIYYHVFSNQKPLLFAKVQKPDLFTNAKELAIMQCWGYFGSDYVYIKLYNILRSANDSYKITINQASGGMLMSLLKTCINTLSLCIEMRSNASNTADAATNNTTTAYLTHQDTAMASYPPAAELKLIEEILQYLTKIINYAPVECIGCLRQLLKYLFARNYGNRQKEWCTTFVQPYFRARARTQWRQQRQEMQNETTAAAAEQSNRTNSMSLINSRLKATTSIANTAKIGTMHSAANNEHNLIVATTNTNSSEDWIIFGELITQGLNFVASKSEYENDCAKHIKLFEPLVIYCLTLFMKSNALVQKPIVELLAQLLEVDVTYSILDSKNVIFEQIKYNLDLIESGIARNGHIIIPPTIKFLVQLTDKSDRKLITIPKIISITNNLLANNAIHECAVLALKSLAYEIFFLGASTIPKTTTSAVATISTESYAEQRAAFQSPISRSPLATPTFSEKRRQQHQQLLPEDDAAAAAEALLVTTRELDTQKEVVLGMLDKFIDARECQHVLGLLLLLERSMQQQQQQQEQQQQQQQLATAATTSGQRQMQQQMQQTQRKLSLQQESAFATSTVNEMPLPLLQLQLQDPGAVYAIICHALNEGRIRVVEWRGFFVLDALFKNCGKLVLADSKEFLSLLQLFITKNVENFSDLSQATIILENVILKTEEIYLVNHIKLYLKNHHQQQQQQQQQHSHQNQPRSTYLLPRLPDGPSTSTAAAAALASGTNNNSNNRSNLTTNPINEIQYFAQVLCEKLDECIAKLTGHLDPSRSSSSSSSSSNFYYDRKYCGLVVRFIRALHNICFCSRLQDALQSVFRLALNKSNFLLKYNNLLTMGIGTGPTPIVVDGQSDTLLQVDGQLLDVELQLQRELLKLLAALRLLDICAILHQLQADNQDIKSNVRRILLREICELNPNPINWNLQQVQQLFHPTFLNILIAENFAFVCSLCEVDEEFCSLWLCALIDNCEGLKNHSIRILTRYAVRFCIGSCSIGCIAKFLHLMGKLHHYAAESNQSALEQLIERTARCLISTSLHHDKNAIYDSFIRMDESGGVGRLQYILLNDLENLNTKSNLQFEQKIIDEKWLFNQLIKFSAQTDYDAQKLARILLDIQSEHKLHKIFTTAEFDLGRTLEPAITCALDSMLATFRNNCMQHNPHINYMQPNPLARVAIAVLMSRIGMLTEEAATVGQQHQHQHHLELMQLAIAVTSLMEHLIRIEGTALIYIEAKFVEKFVCEQLLRYDSIRTLVHFLQFCCDQAKRLLLAPIKEAEGGGNLSASDQQAMFTYLGCIDALLKQRFIWQQLNQIDKVTGSNAFGGGTKEEIDSTAILSQKQRNKLLCNLLDMLFLLATKSIQNTIFYKRYKPNASACIGGENDDTISASANVFTDNNDDDDDADDDGVALLQVFVPKAIFIAKLIETKIDIEAASGLLSTAHISGRGGGGDVVAAAAGFSVNGGGVGAAGGITSGGGSAGGGVGCAVVTGGATVHFDDSFAGIEIEGAQVLLNILKSIGISILRTNQFYAYAVTPFEIIQQQQQQQQQRQQQQQQQQQQQSFGNSGGSNNTTPTKRATVMTSTTTIGKLPTLPVESLSDVDVLRKFVKRLSIFGFTTRQQFEEYFMTFLLLINKVYDENMVDQQEQFQIKSTCLEAILELLITYKTFPIVGNKLSHFHHTTRWSRINCDGISLKKLHKVQLLVSEANVFYQPNLERHLTDINNDIQDTIIGTKYFLINQMDLNFVWQQMEAHSHPTSPNDGRTDANEASPTAGGTSSTSTFSRNNQTTNAEDIAMKNYRHFTENSGIDFKSSSQLIFDVMMQIIEHNHILVLPNLVKFCEICESRDQIKWIKDKALKMQESIPMDDTISHQHIIYLLCKTQAMLIPTLGELQQLCSLIGNYLKSSHVFIRNATLAGVLCLLECCTKTNTTIGKLSEELALLRDLIVGYINRHGLIDQSSIQCSDMHAKLVWTLNFSLIEWTSKFVPQCHLLSNTIIAAANFLRKTTNEELYLCVLHGLERMVVISTINGNNSIVSPVLHQKIEKLALELVKLGNEKFSIPALKLLLSCMYVGSAKQLENTELSNGIVQDDPEIIAQQADKVDILLHCIKSSTRNAAWIYGQVLCQIIRDLVPPNEILTKVIKEFLAINQPHCDVIAMIVYQVFRSAIDSSFQQMLQDWLICSLPTFLALPEQKGVWCLSVIFLSASINLHLIKLFPVVLSAREFRKLGQHEIALFVTAAQDFHAKLSVEQKMRFHDAFKKFQQNQIYAKMLQSL